MDARLRQPEHIFECYIEISRPKDLSEDGQISHLFPKNYAWEEDTKKQIPKFAFPTSAINEQEEHFTFVLTDFDGNYHFGFCRYPPKGDVCMCFLSDLPWFKLFYRVLDKVSDFRLNLQSEMVEPFLSSLYSHKLPDISVEAVLTLVPETEHHYTFPLTNTKKLPEIPSDHNLTIFYTTLHYSVILHLFANLVFERRIIITSSNLTMLSASVHGALLLLYPLHWQHIFIPIMPLHLLDYCAAPMPFLIGVHSSLMEKVHSMPMDDVVIVDMDESTIATPNSEDLNQLPSDVVTNLRHILKKQSSAYADTVARSFLLAQVAMLGGYRSALKCRQGETDVTFDEETFIKSRPHMESFLEELLQFQHFRQFLNERIDRLKNRKDRDLFDNEAMLYEEELKTSTSEQLKLAFDKFFVEGGKRLGDRIGEGSKKLGDKLQKQGNKGWKVTKKIAKQTFQGLIATERVGPGDYYSSTTIENSTLMDKEKRSLTWNGSSKSQSPKARRQPPLVIPYHRHVEGKKKLAESLEIMRKRKGETNLFTPPDTPRSVIITESEEDLPSESVSVDSKESVTMTTVAAASSGGTTGASSSGGTAVTDVATGTLIDFGGGGVIVGSSAMQGGGLAWELDVGGGSSEIESDSSGSNNVPHHWERFDDERPESSGSSSSLFKALQRESIDFSSSIAEALFDTSKKSNDPYAASSLANASMDLLKAKSGGGASTSASASAGSGSNNSSTTLITPLVPITTTSSTTAAYSTSSAFASTGNNSHSSTTTTTTTTSASHPTPAPMLATIQHHQEPLQPEVVGSQHGRGNPAANATGTGTTNPFLPGYRQHNSSPDLSITHDVGRLEIGEPEEEGGGGAVGTTHKRTLTISTAGTSGGNSSNSNTNNPNLTLNPRISPSMARRGGGIPPMKPAPYCHTDKSPAPMRRPRANATDTHCSSATNITRRAEEAHSSDPFGTLFGAGGLQSYATNTTTNNSNSNNSSSTPQSSPDQSQTQTPSPSSSSSPPQSSTLKANDT